MTILPTLDDFIADFEAVLNRDGQANLDSFLPAESHPLRTSILIELIRVELEHDWESGQPQPLESYFRRFPEVFADAGRRREVAFEEYRLRRHAGQDPDPQLYAQNHDIDTHDWPRQRKTPDDSLLSVARSYRDFRRQRHRRPAEVSSWLQSNHAVSIARIFHDVHQSDPRAAERLAEGLTELPSAGETFLDFDLVEELGRGAFGRVFLARQAGLANRLVALKIAPDVGGESQTLAQLQHTHIVPLYSIHRSGPLQAVCMPFFGSVTLADVLRELTRRPSLPQSGSDLLSQLTSHSSPLSPYPGGEKQKTPSPPTPLPQDRGRGEKERTPSTVPSATLKRLEGLSYAESIVWLGCCLADGLAHAHERGILHRDLKPANVLLTDEGQPMLLDFNLAEDVKLRGSISAAVIGGTIPYMAPEQLRTFGGNPTPVDGRADIFALGIILYELLTGHPPFPPPALRAPAGPTDADMDVFVAGVLQSRTSPPITIFQHNRSVTPAVWSILRRCLDADPALRYQDARQLQEDLQHQLDNEPLCHAPDPSLGERMRKRFRRSPKLLSRLVICFTLVLLLVAGGLAYFELEGKKARQQRIDAKQSLDESFSDSIHALFELSIDEGPTRQAKGIKQARAVFERYHLDRDDWRSGPLVSPLTDAERRQLEQQLGELLLVTARAVSSQEALPLLARAEDIFGKQSPAVLLQRAEILEGMGQTDESEALITEAKKYPPRKARDYYVQARKLLQERKFREARPRLQRAVSIEPDNLPAQLLLGSCYYHLDQHKDAVGCYNACLALAPKFRGGFLNRALAYAGQEEHGPAIADYDRVIELDPAEPDGYLDRGLSHLAVGRKHNDPKHFQAAVEDFTRVLQLDPSQSRALFHRSQAKKLLNEQKGAEADFQEGLKREPSDDRSWNLLGDIHRDRNEIQEALRCYDRGVAFNPRSFTNLTCKACLLAEPLGKTNEALEIFDRVVRVCPDFEYAHFNRGILLARMGRRNEALLDAQKALERSEKPGMLYRVACIYAQTSRQEPTDADQALSLLHRALRGEFGIAELPGDADLKPLHPLPEFARLREMARNIALAPRPAASRP